MDLKVRGSLYVLKEAIELGLISKEESIKTLDEMIKDGFRISTRIYAKLVPDTLYTKLFMSSQRGYVEKIEKLFIPYDEYKLSIKS